MEQSISTPRDETPAPVQAPPSPPRSQSPPPHPQHDAQAEISAPYSPLSNLPQYPSPYPTGPSPLLFPYTPCSASASAFDFFHLDFSHQPPHPIYATPTSLLQSPPRFPLPLPAFESVKTPYPPSQPTWPYLPTPKSNPVSPLATSPDDSYFHLDHATLANASMMFVPQLPPMPEFKLSPEELTHEEERRAMEAYLLGVEVEEEVPSVFVEIKREAFE